MLQKIKNNLGWVVLAALGVGAVFVWLVNWQLAPATGIKIEFFDVGQGSAIFIDAGNGNQILIDGGPSNAILAKMGEVLPIFDRRIEMLILTHPDADHLNGLIEVLRRYEVGRILETGIADDSAEYGVWHNLIRQKNIPLVLARAGEVIGLADNLAIEILYPLAEIAGQDFGDKTNKTSIVGKIFYGQNEILFVGDAEEMEEQALIWSKADLRADILVVGHHGSRQASSAAFLVAVAPQTAVIQVGEKNRYGHPAPEVLERLTAVGASIFRTDKIGDIIFDCDLDKCVKK